METVDSYETLTAIYPSTRYYVSEDVSIYCHRRKNHKSHNIKLDLNKYIGRVETGLKQPEQVQWRAFVKTVMNLLVNRGVFLDGLIECQPF